MPSKQSNKKRLEMIKAKYITDAAICFGCKNQNGAPINSIDAVIFFTKKLNILKLNKNQAKAEADVYSRLVQLKSCIPTSDSDRFSSAINQKIRKKKPNIFMSSTDADTFYASWEWKKIRYEVLKKHGPKCQCCGAGRDHGVIVVDHIKPLRKNWGLRLEISNLQVLCDDCNMGKSNTDETDWRDV